MSNLITIYITVDPGHFHEINVDQHQYIIDVMTILQMKGNRIFPDSFLLFHGMRLNEKQKLTDYGIKDGDILHFIPSRICGGGCTAQKPSDVIGYIENDEDDKIISYLDDGLLNKRFIRNTNVTGVYEQKYSNCFAFAACSAYINTVMRIYGSKNPVPSFKECYQIANYNNNQGGNSGEAIQRLERHFNFGVCMKRVNEVSIRDSMMLSVIANFKTSSKGWKSIANGELLWYPGGIGDGRHSALVEGYDLEKDCMICKNSWGGETATSRFDFTPSACHECDFVVVYFTLESIRDKTVKKFIPKIQTFEGSLNKQKINCAWMDKTTALYSTEYVCEYHPEKIGDMNYLGYDVFKWIDINLNRADGSNSSIYQNFNDLQKNEKI